MTTGVDKMLTQIGANMSESMGKGLQEGISQKLAPPAGATEGRLAGRYRHNSASLIDVVRIMPDPAQPRKHFEQEDLEKLAKSLRMHGQLQSCVCRWDETHQKYVLVTGERRWRAAQIAGLGKLKVEVVEKELLPGQVLAQQLVENCVRSDMRPLELAEAYRRLAQFQGWTNAQVAEVLSTTAGHVSKILSLLELPEDLKQHVNDGVIPSSTAYEIARLTDDALRRQVAADFLAKRLDRNGVIAAVQASVGKKRSAPAATNRLTFRLPTATLTITAATPLTYEQLIESLDHIRKSAMKAHKQGEVPVEAFAKNGFTKGLAG